ncbi:MAG: RHS repeat-associated core domain-containing protein [Phycisphaerae bacterium]
MQLFGTAGVPIERIALATTNPPTTQAACAARSCELCNGLNDPGSRGRAATGPLGYHGQEGYATNCDDPDRLAPLDTADPQYEGYDSTWSAGYEDRSTGILHVGARDYEPATGRFLQPDPVRVGPESLAGMLNRWVYCANDPVNFSDPSGMLLGSILGSIAITIGFFLVVAAIELALPMISNPMYLIALGLFPTATLALLLPALSLLMLGLAAILQGFSWILGDQRVNGCKTLDSLAASLAAGSGMSGALAARTGIELVKQAFRAIAGLAKLVL